MLADLHNHFSRAFFAHLQRSTGLVKIDNRQPPPDQPAWPPFYTRSGWCAACWLPCPHSPWPLMLVAEACVLPAGATTAGLSVRLLTASNFSFGADHLSCAASGRYQAVAHAMNVDDDWEETVRPWAQLPPLPQKLLCRAVSQAVLQGLNGRIYDAKTRQWLQPRHLPGEARRCPHSVLLETCTGLLRVVSAAGA